MRCATGSRGNSNGCSAGAYCLFTHFDLCILTHSGRADLIVYPTQQVRAISYSRRQRNPQSLLNVRRGDGPRVMNDGSRIPPNLRHISHCHICITLDWEIKCFREPGVMTLQNIGTAKSHTPGNRAVVQIMEKKRSSDSQHLSSLAQSCPKSTLPQSGINE